jgi:ubiquinone/menaquinone biosynthesis C-methylase UbiE
MRQHAAIERRVEQHYAQRDLEQTILKALTAGGKDPDRLTPGDLSPVDEFHTGGYQATVELASQIDVTPGMHLLDVGCGIGGPSRFFANEHGCRVTGIDLTEDYVRIAEALARRVGLADRVSYRQASALTLPFDDSAFDGAYMMHVGMNIEDKTALLTEVRRVLKAGGFLAIYDVMRTGDGALGFPLHWAATSETSFVVSASAYQSALEAAGFEVVTMRDRGDFARAFFRQIDAGAEPPPLGIHLLMKRDVPQKTANYRNGLEAGVIAPIEMICRCRP